MNIKQKNKKTSVLLFSALTVLVFFGCQTALQLEETMSLTDVYKYGTKEFNPQSQTVFYDYGARYYNPAVGSFATIDSVAERYPNISPYTYVLGKPAYIDLKTDSIKYKFR